MNFYKRYPGDYARDTGHLSLAAHGAYTLLLDRYYSTGAIPSSKQELYVLCRAINKSDRLAVDKVVSEFFPDGRNHRADEEIEAWKKQAEHNRGNGHYGSLGGRPKKPKVGLEENPERVSGETHGGGQTKPLSRSQTPEEDSRRGEAPPVSNPPDPRKAMFDLGVKLLGERHRGLIGKAVSQIGEQKVAEILGGMAVKPPVDPAAYFAKAIQPEERKVAV